MTYIELLLLIEQRSEKIITDKSHSLYTDKHLYVRLPNALWEERELPVLPDKFQPIKVVEKQDKKSK